MANRTRRQTERGKRSAYLTGLIVALALALLTAIEYWFGIQTNPSVLTLMLISVVKSALVIYFFMHVYRLWRTEGSH